MPLSQTKQNSVLADMLDAIAKKHGVTFDDINTQFQAGCKVEREHGDELVAAKIALDHLNEDATYYTKLSNFEDMHNAVSQKPRFFYARHMQPGTCRYDKEVVLVDTDALQAMIKTGAGIPVFIHHQVGVPAEDVKEKAVGYVTESFYNELDGWAWFKFMAIDDEAFLCISQKWSVSNAYRPTQWGNSGTKNNVNYDREFISGEFTHLAIVPNPRYENACIMTPEEFKAYQDGKKQSLEELHNSLPNHSTSKGTTMFKFFKNKREDVSNASDATHVELDGGKIVTVEEMVNAVKKNEAESDAEAKREEKEKEEKENDMVDVQGEKMPLKELINRYSKLNEKKNADDEAAAKKEKEDKEAEEKKNAEDEAKKKEADDKAKKDEDEKTNGKGYFEQMLNAHMNAGADSVQIIETTGAMTARGQARYGSAS